MNVKIPLKTLSALLMVAIAVGYLMGTEAGREQRDQLLVKLGRKQAEAEQAIAEVEQILEEVAAD